MKSGLCFYPGVLEIVTTKVQVGWSGLQEMREDLFSTRKFCTACGNKDFEEVKLSGDGEILTYTIIARGAAPPEFNVQQKTGGPFAVAIVKLDEGPTIVGQITDCDPSNIRIQMKVESVIRRIYEQEGVIRYGFKFRPKQK